MLAARRIVAAVGAMAMTGALSVGLSGAAGAEPPPPTAGPDSEVPASSAQERIDAYMKEVPGGEQVSDNAVSFRDGEVIMVFPDAGQRRAPDGLGRNVRENAPPLETTIPVAYGEPTYPMRTLATAYLEGCPYSTDGPHDWYCFYEHASWGGRRLQFKDTCSGSMLDWGFNDQTTSWVNTNGAKTIYTYDHGNYTVALWTEPEGPVKSSNVGATFNDRMTTWTASGSPGSCP